MDDLKLIFQDQTSRFKNNTCFTFNTKFAILVSFYMNRILAQGFLKITPVLHYRLGLL